MKLRVGLLAAMALWSLLCSLLLAWPLRAEGELVRALASRRDFLADSQGQKLRANWLKLIEEFEAAALAQYDPRHASRARYLGAELSLDSANKFKQEEDLQRAVNLARRSVRDCPHCSHSAAAQLIYGQALAAQGRTAEAERQLMKVELNYPDSPEVAAARGLLTKIRGGPPPSPAPEKKELSEPAAAEKKSSSPPSARPADKKTAPAAQKPAEKESPPPSPPPARADGLAQVYHLSLSDEGRSNSVTVYLDKPVSYVYNLIEPRKKGGYFRAYADLKGAALAPGLPLTLKQNSSLVRLVKINQFSSESVRLVLDLPEPYPLRAVLADGPVRFVFQVAKEAGSLAAEPKAMEAQKSSKPAPKAAPAEKAPASSPAPRGGDVSLARQLGLKVRTVIIDPGHGGKDGGAAAHGLVEKNITLSVARRLAALIESRLGLKVFLTRSDDRFVTLSRRTKIARDRKGDLFISLHVNANTRSSAEGFETYILNFTADRSAMAVAARENASSDKSVSELEDLLQIIAKNTKIAESKALAQALHKGALGRLNQRWKQRDLGVKEAPFHVLAGVNVPSVLVEMGFITNKKEAGRLGEAAYLNALALGLYQGLESYLRGL